MLDRWRHICTIVTKQQHLSKIKMQCLIISVLIHGFFGINPCFSFIYQRSIIMQYSQYVDSFFKSSPKKFQRINDIFFTSDQEKKQIDLQFGMYLLYIYVRGGQYATTVRKCQSFAVAYIDDFLQLGYIGSPPFDRF